jgi:spermidine synthase
MKYKYIVFMLFFASGISGLMYEVVWLRMLTRITGVTIYATATVLAAFMSGLALGSFFLGRFIDKREDALRVYAVLEFLVACAALLVPFLFTVSVHLFRYVYDISGENMLTTAVVRAIASFVSLLLPTTIMGGTLPVLTSCLVKRDNLFGRNMSVLYGLNTLGAVCGVLLSGFVTIGELGEWATLYIGAAINVVVAMLAYFVYLRDRKSAAVMPVTRSRDTSAITISPYGDRVRSVVLVAFAVSGFTALAYEVIWTRQLILFLETSIYAFSGMLAIFLAGIALGSVSMNKVADRLSRPLAFFGALELAVGILSVLNLFLFLPLDGPSAKGLLGWFRPIFAALIIVFPMTFVFGLAFPVAGLCYAKHVENAGASVGRLYGANTVGSILGSLFAGFLLVPALGSTKTVVLLACLNVALGMVLFALEPGRTFVQNFKLAPVVLVFVALTTVSFGRDPFLATIERRIYGMEKHDFGATGVPKKPTEIYFHKEGLQGTVTAFSVNNRKHLWVNGIGMTYLCTETKLMAHLPLMFARDPKEFLVICFGMGTTVKSAALYPNLSITAVELVPETFDTFKFYHPGEEEVLKRKNVNLVANDGRNHLLLSKKKYDVITVDPAPPIWSAGTVNLYTREFFQLCRENLTPDGVMCLWFPGGLPEDGQAILRTFSEVFPESSVWKGPRNWGFYCIGTIRETPWDEFEKNARNAFLQPAMVRDLTEYDNSCDQLHKFYGLHVMNKAQIHSARAAGALITDDNPFTEFFLWRRLWLIRKAAQ